MINFNIEKSLLLIFLVLTILVECISCQNNQQNYIETNSRIGFNRYQLFEEPSTEEIVKLKFYLLIISQGSFENAYILSIRKDSTNKTYGYYKTIDRDMMPPMSNEIKADTLPFIYSTIYFKLKSSDIDTLQVLMQDYKINQLKDTLETKLLGGRSRELIVFNKGIFFNVFRDYGSETSVEKNFLDFLNTVIKKFTPSEPVPSFRR